LKIAALSAGSISTSVDYPDILIEQLIRDGACFALQRTREVVAAIRLGRAARPMDNEQCS
jgi:hypothetical protein